MHKNGQAIKIKKLLGYFAFDTGAFSPGNYKGVFVIVHILPPKYQKNSMVILRLLLIAFNVAVVTYLVYRMFQVIKDPYMTQGRKTLIVVTGVVLLLAPFSMFFGIMNASFLYFMIYPVALSLFLYLIREVDSGS